MKTAMIILALLMAGCSDSDNYMPDPEKYSIETKTPWQYGVMATAKHDGHEWFFPRVWGEYAVHHPDCPCVGEE